MNISVVGLWHLGSVTSICLAEKGFKIIGYDRDEKVVEDLRNGIPPIFEPGLQEMLAENLEKSQISFTTDPSPVSLSDLIWVAYDTPVDENDIADTSFVENELIFLFPYLKNGSMVLISSQMPVGSVRRLEKLFYDNFPEISVSFSISPENLRLGKAIDVFMNPDRIVIGVRNQEDKMKLAGVLERITTSLVWMGVESAEMTKHAINAFLATSVVFINEIAVLCEQVGANAKEVEKGLKSEFRIGPKAYLRPGNAFAGGTLARDIQYLILKQKEFDLSSVFFTGILESNEEHKSWMQKKLSFLFNNLQNKTVGILGLTYKPGTDTLRRSSAIELCYWLDRNNVNILAYDPLLKSLPEELSSFISLQESADSVIKQSDAVVLATECPEFKNIKASSFQDGTYVLDANGFLEASFENCNLKYLSIGR
jgi:UDPglucose 6-dehydrogenase